jgi:hypothetical protein
VEQDQTIDVAIRGDHRVTDAPLIDEVLTRLELEQVQNIENRGRLPAKPARFV